MEVVRGTMLRTALLVTLVAGCDLGTVGGGTAVTDGGGGSADANGAGAASFTSMIEPLVVTRTCLVGGTCHMVQNPKLDTFANLQSSEALYAPTGRYLLKAGMSVIVKGPASLVGGPGGTHQGITYFNATEIGTISAWIDSL